jgi:hypothetical protein
MGMISDSIPISIPEIYYANTNKYMFVNIKILGIKRRVDKKIEFL